MWKGRFAQETSALVQRYGESVSFDWRLYAHDIAGSIAHSKGLLKAGIITAEEQSQIESGLLTIRAEIEKGDFEFKEALEDVHMNVEAELTKRIGPAGAKLHTARSRNDQVATDVRLYCRSSIDAILKLTRAMQAALVECAERGGDAVMPGYTHLQRGQPVFFAHHLLAYVEMLERDAARSQQRDVARVGAANAVLAVFVCTVCSGASLKSRPPLFKSGVLRQAGDDFCGPVRDPERYSGQQHSEQQQTSIGENRPCQRARPQKKPHRRRTARA